MNKKLPEATAPSGSRQTLLKVSASFRTLAATLTALAALGSGVYLHKHPAEGELQHLNSKWKWLLFASTLIAAFMIYSSVKFYLCLRAISTDTRRRGERLFIITCVVMALLEFAVGCLAFKDSRSSALQLALKETNRSTEWVILVVVYSVCLLLIMFELMSIAIALLCVRSQLYERVASAKESKDVLEFERRPSSYTGVDDTEFKIDEIDEGTKATEDGEKQPLQKDDDNDTPLNKSKTMLVNNELYEVPQAVLNGPKEVTPPLPPAKDEEVNVDCPPPLPSSPIPDEVDKPKLERTPTFRKYEKRPRGSTPSTNPIFPHYEPTAFSNYNPQLGTFHRPCIPSEQDSKPSEEQEASQLQPEP